MAMRRTPGEDKGVNSQDSDKLDRVIAAARRARDARERGYREQALRLLPWVCGKCGREFERSNLRELTVHHRDHDHDNNPADGSNWELLCLYCHDDEHARGLHSSTDDSGSQKTTTHKPFASLKQRLNEGDKKP